MLGYVLDEIFVQHRAPSGHPERPARAEAVRDALLKAGIVERGTQVPIREATDEELARVHSGGYLDDLVRTIPGKTGWIDADTYYSPRSWEAARAAAGATSRLALDVMRGELSQGIAVVRPPGHHAERDRGMGFCLLNNVAVAAAAARAHGATRVAIVVWDVDHGNGTQDIFWDDPSVLYLSIHQYPYYPGTGAPSEIGGPNALGTTVNVGLPSGSGDAEYLAVFDHVIVPALESFAPDLIFVSAGFDAFQHDPLAGMRVTFAGFAAMAARLRSVADRLAGGRIVVVLEGGYDLDGLAGGMTNVLAVLKRPALEPIALTPLPAFTGSVAGLARAAIDATLAAHHAHGPLAAKPTR
ncbi:MAG: histone deacetylase [Proteobacteria bacterium]|nr:histone deacetylase [Pseudomonadota bacterium]